MPPAPTDKDRPRRRRRRASAPSTTDRTSPGPRPSAPKKGPPSPQRTGRATRPQPTPRRPRASGPSAFEPFRATHGIEREESKARSRSRKAREKLPADPRIPRIPVKRTYTPRERRLVHLLYDRAAREAGVPRPRDLYFLGNQSQRRNMRDVAHALLGGIEKVEQNRRERETYTIRAGESGPSLPKRVLSAGLGFTNPNPMRNTAVQAAGQTALNVGRATYEDPVQVGQTSLRVAKESITGIPQGLKQIAEDPVEAVEQIVQDYEDRYGSVLKDPKAFRERVKTDWGLTPYAFDAMALAGGTGQAAGAVARSTRFARAAEAMATAEVSIPGARALGRAGQRANRAVTTQRPGLRVSGAEEGGVQPQRRSRNLFAAVGQDVLDRRRASWLEGRRAQPGKQRVLEAAVREGEVTPIVSGIRGRSLRETPFLRRYTGRTARDLGGAQSTTRLRILTTSGRTEQKIRRAFDRLDKRQKVAVREMAELGVKADAAGLAALERRLAQIDPDSPDAVAIREVLSDPDTYLTAEARAVVDEVRDEQIAHAANDPRLPEATELLRRLEPQARLLDVKRGPNVERFRDTLRKIEQKTGVDGLARYADELASAMPEDRPALAKKIAKDVRKQVKAAERDVETARRRTAVAETIADSGPRITTPEITEARRELARLTRARDRLKGELVGRKGEGYAVAGVRDGRTFRIEALREKITEADEAVKAQRATVRELEANAPRTTEAQAKRVERRRLELAARRETRDYLRSFERGIKQIHRKTKAQARKFDPRLLEDYDEFAARVRAAADDAGLAEPAYWKGLLEGDLDEAPRLKAAGKGLRATEKPKRTEFKLTDAGRGERDPEVLIQGVNANIKRRFQYQLVVRNIEKHAFDWSRGKGNGGMTIDEIKWYLRENNIDPKTVEMLDTRIITRSDADAAPDLEDPVASGLEEIADHRVSGKQLGKMIERGDYKDMAQNRYLVFPREVGEAVDGLAVKSDSTFTRMMEVVLKQKPARIMLGAANFPWLAFQMASNTMLTGLGGGINPFDIYGAHKWFKGLDIETRDAIEAELGITRGHHFQMDQPNLGATNSRMVAMWRGFKSTKAMRLGHRMNPLDAMFRADEFQNNFFRRTLFYSKARKAAYRRMGSNWRGIDRNVSTLMDRVMGKPPDRMAQAIAKHGPEFEAAAKHTRDFLGDYVRFSPSERFLLSRNIMFYGYLRFSLRFAFYTMPVGHPIMTAILSDIGRMGAQEIKDIFGVPDNYALPTSMLAQTYTGTRTDAENGTLRSINFGRMNPFLNAVTQMEDLNQAAGLLSPMYGMLADQMFEESSFTGRDWRVGGEYTPSESERPRNYYGMEERGRIALRQLLKLGFPYRVAEEMVLEPSQSDDALAWSPRPLHPKEEEAKRGVAKSRRVWEEEGQLRRLGAGLIPILPTVTAAPQVIKREREKEKAQADRAKGKKKRRRRRSPAGSFGGGGGSSFGGGGGGGFGG